MLTWFYSPMPDPARLFQPQAAIASSAYIRASGTKCSSACSLEGDDVRRANAASDIAPNQFGIVGQLAEEGVASQWRPAFRDDVHP